jgi:hypothetical protein
MIDAALMQFTFESHHPDYIAGVLTVFIFLAAVFFENEQLSGSRLVC